MRALKGGGGKGGRAQDEGRRKNMEDYIGCQTTAYLVVLGRSKRRRRRRRRKKSEQEI